MIGDGLEKGRVGKLHRSIRKTFGLIFGKVSWGLVELHLFHLNSQRSTEGRTNAVRARKKNGSGCALPLR